MLTSIVQSIVMYAVTIWDREYCGRKTAVKTKGLLGNTHEEETNSRIPLINKL